MGRAHAATGELDKSRGAYEKFLELWKDADADLPVLRQARAEFSQLKKKAA